MAPELSFLSLQDKSTPEIVLKAMGRAINKTVTIAEIIKVSMRAQNKRFYAAGKFSSFSSEIPCFSLRLSNLVIEL